MSRWRIGLLISLANTLTLPIPMIAGWLADRVGPLPLVVGAQIAQATGYLIYTVAGDPVGIFLSSSLVALGVRFFWSTVFTAIADFADGSTSSMSKDVWFAWASMARTAGFSIGSLITAAAISFANEAAYKALTVGAAVSFLVAGMVIGVGVRAPRRAHDTGEDGAAAGGYRGMLRDGPFLSYTGINAIFATTMTMLALGLPIFMADGLQGRHGWLRRSWRRTRSLCRC
ncbi:MFS transporter [Nonomuraea sp. NPDC050202]|uniref:MFS transporter n=1 Tax=Nonomuraea sp. NPDC050202 TaxID=3155035 RepID=UPI0033F6E7DC